MSELLRAAAANTAAATEPDADLAAAAAMNMTKSALFGKRNKTQRWKAIAKRSKIVGMVSLATRELTQYSHLSPAELKLKKQMLAAVEQKGVKIHKEEDIVLPGFERIVQETADERQQGDMTLYTSGNLKKRTALRRDPHVLAAMKIFWEIGGLKQKLDCPHAGEYCSTCGHHRNEHPKYCIKRDQYVSMMKRFRRLLVEEECEDEEIEADWEEDISAQSSNNEMGKAHNALFEEGLYDSLFEMVDMWVTVIDARDYVWWLSKLYNTVTEMHKGMARWKLLQHILFDEVFSDKPEQEIDEEIQKRSEEQAAARRKSLAENDASGSLQHFLDDTGKQAREPQRQKRRKSFAELKNDFLQGVSGKIGNSSSPSRRGSSSYDPSEDHGQAQGGQTKRGGSATKPRHSSCH